MKLNDLAAAIGAAYEGPEDIEIVGAAGIQDAVSGQISFLDGKNFQQLENTQASAVLVHQNTPSSKTILLRVNNPRLAFAHVLALLYGTPYSASGISNTVVIGKNVVIGSDPSFHPYVVIEDGARIGNRVSLYPGVYVGKRSIIDDDSILYANVSVREGIKIGKRVIIHAGAVIGSDGFGFVTDGGKHHKMPQVGGVIIEDDVEIGANTTIDRATLGNTLIKEGTKIDNLVQIAHNVTIGKHCFLMSQVGIAGSCTLGDHVILAGQVGLADHITIKDRVMIAAKSGIMRDIDEGQIAAGIPAISHREWLKVHAVLPKLPELKKQIAELEKQVQELKNERTNT
ncbi:MAG: UDP-3-O-(3-hydroxymyristoyl)glucosamine N-acyltransferase [Nitrospirota bacterium]